MAPASPLNRREFLQASAALGATLAVGSTATASAPVGTAKSCIFLMLTGGPSQLDTWDPKPDAPSEIRGPFAPTRTRVPGVLLSELFPKMAATADKFSLVRTMHHEYAPIHENGFQLLNTGRRFGDGEWPWVGSVVDHLTWGGRYDPFGTVILPFDEPDTGVKLGRSFGGAWLTMHEPTFTTWDNNDATLIECCEYAARAVYRGTRFVTINPFPTVFDRTTWDCHADRGALRSTLADYRGRLAPEFDAAFTYLLESLDRDGLLAETLVVAVGEFGRTPRLNCNGGRDHWANCWTALVAGGGVQGGRAIGQSDAHAAEPKDRPVHCAELVATIYHAMGVPPATTIPGPDGRPARVVEADPVLELF